MEAFTAMAGRKRSRGSDYDDEVSMDAWADFSDEVRKRPRNDTLVDSTLGMGMDESKPLFAEPEHPILTFTPSQTRPPLLRAHTLPFRLPGFPTLSSLQSPDFNTTASSDQSTPDSSSPRSLASLPTFADHGENGMDIEMAVEEPTIHIRGSQSPVSPFRVPNRPPKLNPVITQPRLNEGSQFAYSRLPTPISLHSQSSSPNSQFASSRIPTPIHPFFPSTSSSSLHYSSGLMSPSQPSTSALFNGHSPIRLLATQSPNRPMPSPIREDSMDDINTDYAGSQLSRLSVSESMDMDDGSPNDQSPYSPSIDMGSRTELEQPPRKGRARSGAMVTTNKRIFMGYMADCEKCQLKVPGHSVHILPA